MLTHNGKTYARVSEVIRPFSNLGGIPEDILKRKAEIGTGVHKIINEDIEGDFPVVTPESLGYFQSYQKWRSLLSPVFIESEVRYYDDDKRITGAIDCLVKLQGEEGAILVDFKTSVAESPTWIMQGHLYRHLILGAGKPIADRFLFLKLSKDGGFPTVFQYKFDPNIYQKCLQAIDDFWDSVDDNSL